MLPSATYCFFTVLILQKHHCGWKFAWPKFSVCHKNHSSQFCTWEKARSQYFQTPVKGKKKQKEFQVWNVQQCYFLTHVTRHIFVFLKSDVVFFFMAQKQIFRKPPETILSGLLNNSPALQASTPPASGASEDFTQKGGGWGLRPRSPGPPADILDF